MTELLNHHHLTPHAIDPIHADAKRILDLYTQHTINTIAAQYNTKPVDVHTLIVDKFK